MTVSLWSCYVDSLCPCLGDRLPVAVVCALPRTFTVRYVLRCDCSDIGCLALAAPLRRVELPALRGGDHPDDLDALLPRADRMCAANCGACLSRSAYLLYTRFDRNCDQFK